MSSLFKILVPLGKKRERERKKMKLTLFSNLLLLKGQNTTCAIQDQNIKDNQAVFANVQCEVILCCSVVS